MNLVGTAGRIEFIDEHNVQVVIINGNLTEYLIVPISEMDRYFEVIGVLGTENKDIVLSEW